MTKTGLWALVIMSLFSCREPFVSPAFESAPSYLVVDGFIQSDGIQATIKLSRTRNLNDTAKASPEMDAHVTLIGSNFGVYKFTPSGPGTYTFPNLSLDFSQSYRLDIVTAEGKDYLSDSINPKRSPEIDSLHWELSLPGVNIFLTTHDPNNNTKYYRWEYAETYEHRAKTASYIRYVGNGTFVNRTADEQIFQCWKTDSLTDILIGSSEQLKEDIIYQQPIKFIVQGSDEISYICSLIVYQYALNAEAYEYWGNLKKNTELTGSLFDPQPSGVSGNMHCVSDPSEPVLGFISAGSVTSKRIFITYDELAYWYYKYPYPCGMAISVPFAQVDRFFRDSTLFVPLSIALGGVLTTGTECGDCRYNGAVNRKPDFFP